MKLINDCSKILKKEPNIIEKEGSIAIIGDIHGQLFDMVSMLDELTPKLDQKNSDFGILFLGDYVDRGIKGVEVLIYLMTLKIVYPKKITLLRGNHESRNMTESFTFRDECISKFDSEVYDMFMDFFDSLPLASVVNGLYLCVHGGISPEMFEISDINKIDRF